MLLLLTYNATIYAYYLVVPKIALYPLLVFFEGFSAIHNQLLTFKMLDFGSEEPKILKMAIFIDDTYLTAFPISIIVVSNTQDSPSCRFQTRYSSESFDDVRCGM